MEKLMKKIAIITIDFNKDQLTHDFLKQIPKIATPNFELITIVVDNASASPFVLTKTEKTQPIIVLRNQINSGFTGGCNRGIKYALRHHYDYVLLLNNDILINDKNLVAELFTAAENNPQAGIIGPKIYFAPGHEFHKARYQLSEIGHVFWFAGGKIDWANIMNQHRGVDEVDVGQYDQQETTEFVSGCCMLMPTSVFKKIGLFDNKYFLYFEDGDLNERVKRAGYSLLYAPAAKLWHLAGGSTGGIGSSLQDYFLTRNRMLFGLRYAPIRSKIALIRESIRFLFTGREWQRKGIKDFYLRNFGQGSYPLQKSL